MMININVVKAQQFFKVFLMNLNMSNFKIALAKDFKT